MILINATVVCNECHKTQEFITSVEIGEFSSMNPSRPQGWIGSGNRSTDYCSEDCREKARKKQFLPYGELMKIKKNLSFICAKCCAANVKCKHKSVHTHPNDCISE